MKNNKSLLSYILGGLTVLLFIPVVEQISEIVITYLEEIKGKVSKRVLKINKELMDIQAEQEPVSTQCIGFTYNGDEEDDDDYFEDKMK